MTLEINIDEVGRSSAIYSDELRPIAMSLGSLSIARASHVEPDGTGWTADMSPVGGPVLFAEDGRPFETREAALKAEVAWLKENLW